jgi:hypothetical protein
VAAVNRRHYREVTASVALEKLTGNCLASLYFVLGQFVSEVLQNKMSWTCGYIGILPGNIHRCIVKKFEIKNHLKLKKNLCEEYKLNCLFTV